MSTSGPDRPEDPYGSPGPADPSSSPYGSAPRYDAGSPQGSPPSYQGAPSYYGGPPPGTRDNNDGVIALVTGLIGIFLCQPVGIAAIVYGRRSQAAQAAGTADNGVMGTIGFWLGVVSVALMVVVVVLFGAGILSLAMFSTATT